MPGSKGKSSTSRGITRNAATGRFVKKPYARTLSKVIKVDPSTTDPRKILHKVVFPVHSIHGERAFRGERSPTFVAGGPAWPSVDQFTNSVLVALKGILGKRLQALVSADIDITSLGAPTDVAEWLASALPASHPFDELIGPFYDIDGVSRRLRVSHNEVLRYVEDGRLLGCPTDEGTLVFPISQFNPDGSSAAGLERVLKTMATGTADPWQIALWMNTPCEQLNDQTPAQTLQHGDARIVEELAAQAAARWRH